MNLIFALQCKKCERKKYAGIYWRKKAYHKKAVDEVDKVIHRKPNNKTNVLEYVFLHVAGHSEGTLKEEDQILAIDGPATGPDHLSTAGSGNAKECTRKGPAHCSPGPNPRAGQPCHVYQALLSQFSAARSKHGNAHWSCFFCRAHPSLSPFPLLYLPLCFSIPRM